MNTVTNDKLAPNRSPNVRENIITVPANAIFSNETKDGLVIIQIDATNPFEYAKRIMKTMGKASWLKTTGS